MAVAASAAESYSTLVFAVTRRVAIEPGDNIVVLGGGGGIGLAAVDVPHGLGARVVAVPSTMEKRAAVLAGTRPGATPAETPGRHGHHH